LSVTFTVEQDTTNFVIVCSCGENELTDQFVTYEEAAVAVLSTPNTCDDEFCAAWPTRITAVEEEVFTLELDGLNASYILDALGVMDEDEREIGFMPADDFLGRVLLAQAILPHDDGFPAFTEGSETYAGRPDGFLDEKLTKLREIATEALSADRMVIWA
jgi:hypothetical protein